MTFSPGATRARLAPRWEKLLIVPVVAFLPAQGGGPVFSPVVSWTDTSLEWRVPTTSYHGPGWLHVITNGVPVLTLAGGAGSVLPGSGRQVPS